MRKLLLLIVALLTGVSGAWATDIVFSSDEIKSSSNGGTNPATFYDGSGNVVSSTAWCRSFTTNTSIPITFTVGSLDRFSNYSGGFNTAGNVWITATVPSNYSQYSIRSVSFKAKTLNNASKIVYVEGNDGGKVTLNSGEYQSVSSGDLRNSSIRFRFADGTNDTNGECIVVFEDFSFSIDAEVEDAVASISNNHIYRIFTYNNGSEEGSQKYYLTTTGNLTTEQASAGEFTFTATTTAGYAPAGSAWKISNNGNRFSNRPYQATGQNHLNTTSTNNRDTYEAQVFYLSDSKYAIRSTNYNGNSANYVENAYWTVVEDITEDGIPDASYDDTNVGSKHYIWQLEEVNTVVYYNLIYNGETIANSQRNRSEVLGTPSLPLSSWEQPYCTYTYSPTEITSETETVNITMNWVGPFAFSSSYANATWYHMSLNNKWAKYDASVNGQSPNPLYADENQVNYDVAGFAGMWAFIGNPLEGVYLINREAGDGQCLGWTTPAKMQSTSEGSSKKWAIGKQSDTKFTLHYTDNWYVNDYSGNNVLSLWNSSEGANVAGSAMTVKEISKYELALMELDEYAKLHAEGQLFGLKESAVTGLRNQIKAAKASFSDEAYSTAQAAINELWPGTDNANVEYPSTGQYLIRSNGRNPYRYMQIDNTGKPVNTAEKTGIGNVVTLVDVGNHKYKLQMQGLYLDAPTYTNDFQDMTASNEGAEFDVIIASPAVVGFQSGSAWNCIHPRNSGTFGLMSYWGPSTDAASGWVVEQAETVTIPLSGAIEGKSYGTFSAPFDVTIGDGAQAHTVKLDGDRAVYTQITSKQIPQNTGILLISSEAAASVTATIRTEGDAFAAISNEDNDLRGYFLETTFSYPDENTDWNLVLGNSATNGIGFYKMNGTASANKAYLVYPHVAGSSVKGFSLVAGDDVDGIQSIGNEQHDAPIFNLAGQRVLKAQKGLYIIGGKKVIVK